MQVIKLFSFVFLFLLLVPVSIEAYNSNWTHKKLITINNTQNSNNLLDYQVFLNISYEYSMKSDFSDIRFAWLNSSSNSEASISYFIENYKNNSFAELWTKIPKIRANDYETVYVYYGNPSANSESSSNATLELYDNFDNYTSISDYVFQNKYNIFVSGGSINLVNDGNGGKEVEAINSGTAGWQGGTLQTKARYNCTQAKFDYRYGYIYGSMTSHYGFVDKEAYDFWNYKNYTISGWWNGETAVLVNNNSVATSVSGSIFSLAHKNLKIEWCYPYSLVYLDNTLIGKINNITSTPVKPLHFSFGQQEGAGKSDPIYLDNLLIAKFSYPEPSYFIDNGSGSTGTNMTLDIPSSIKADNVFSVNAKIADSQNIPVANLSSSDFRLFRDSEQTDFTDFKNHNNGTYSLNASGGNTIGNISFRIEAAGASAESSAKVTIEPKTNSVFIASEWETIFSAGLTGKPIFTNYSETEKYYFGKIRPEQVFVFDNITTDYPTYRFKDNQAFLETFYQNNTALLVSDKEQALAAASYAKLKNYPILMNNDNAEIFDNIINISGKTNDEITAIAIKEFSKAGKNINTIIIANPQTEISALAGALAAKHSPIILPMNFYSVSYPEIVSDFYVLNGANGVLRIKQKINDTIKKLSDSFLFSNSIDYKIGRIQLNLILLGNASEVPQPAVFDSGREMFFDDDSNYLLSDFPYADANGDGSADLVAGRIVSPYQLVDLPKENKITTAALYRNFETIFSGNGLIESQATDAAFRTAGFETARLVENRTNLSYYELTFGLSNVTDFLKKLFSDLSITESLKLMESIYGGYNELLEHNYYKMLSSMRLGWNGLTIKMFPDKRLTKESLLGEMQNADGIFYYGKGGKDYWQLESFFGDKIHYSDFPATGALIYGEHTNSARFPENALFEKGISAFVGSSGIIYDVYSFMPNSKFAQAVARNRSVALALEESKYPLLPQQIKNLTATLRFNYQPENDLAIKQFLEMICYCDPEKKIDPDAQDYGNNPIINRSATFISRIRIPTAYLATGNRLFFDAKDYLQEMGNPVVPLYSAETILPNGSRIIGIGFDYNSTKYENISADFVPADEHFAQPEAVRGFYPSEMFYSETFDLLDGRKSIKLIAAGMKYNNDTKEAEILDGVEAVIEYSSPFEFVGFSAKNITSGKNQTFSINAAGENLSILIAIKGGNFSETIEQKIPSGVSEINWAPPFIGSYAATAYALMGNNSAGPRYAAFSVSPPADFFMMLESFGTSGYSKIMKSFSEKVMFAFGGAAAIMEYVNPLERFSSSANASSAAKGISSPEYSFSVSQDSEKIVYRMKDSRGELVLERDSGAENETCKGDCSELYGRMSSKLAKMQKLQDYAVENIGS